MNERPLRRRFLPVVAGILFIGFALGALKGIFTAQGETVHLRESVLTASKMISEGERAVFEVTVVNGTRQAVDIVDSDTSCGCTDVAKGVVFPMTVQPGDSEVVAFEVDTTAMRGEQRYQAILDVLAHQGGSRMLLEAEFRFTVACGLHPIPGQVIFGDIKSNGTVDDREVILGATLSRGESELLSVESSSPELVSVLSEQIAPEQLMSRGVPVTGRYRLTITFNTSAIDWSTVLAATQLKEQVRIRVRSGTSIVERSLPVLAVYQPLFEFYPKQVVINRNDPDPQKITISSNADCLNTPPRVVHAPHGLEAVISKSHDDRHWTLVVTPSDSNDEPTQTSSTIEIGFAADVPRTVKFPIYWASSAPREFNSE